MEIKELKIKDVIPYENNPRKNRDAVQYVRNSIEQFGFKVPIIIDRNNVIVAGHTRLEAAKELGMDTVPCVVAEDLTDEQVKAFRLADNKVGEYSTWDFDLLQDELEEIETIGMEDFGFASFFDDDQYNDDITFKEVNEVETKTQCPKCGYEW